MIGFNNVRVLFILCKSNYILLIMQINSEKLRNLLYLCLRNMATLHIFNPEHDIALASNLANFTAPHAGRQLRADLGFLPALWAKEGDAILVDNVEYAEKAWRRVAGRLSLSRSQRFLTKSQLSALSDIDAIRPWGWDSALKAVLKRSGVQESLLPSDAQLDHIRQLSHRRVAAALLPQLQTEGTVGEAYECTQPSEVEALLARYGQVVMKAPWSSSGRGLRFLSASRTPFEMQAGWFRNVVERQGSVMVEPYYSKVKDFGMEFYADADGRIRYEGLSLFHTINGAYVGNVLATENAKREIISRYIPVHLLDTIEQKITNTLSLGDYCGPFGIDMMIVEGKVHPCVEINLRRTMGHVALSLTPNGDEVQKVMRIRLTDHYKLSINKL